MFYLGDQEYWIATQKWEMKQLDITASTFES